MASSEPGRPIRTERLVRAAAGRAFVRDLVARAGGALVVGAVIALLLVGADKLAGGLAPWPVLVAVPLGAAALLAVVWSVLRRWTPLRAAIELDRSLGLKDRLSSALAFSQVPRRGEEEDPFVTIAVRDAEETAGGVRLDRAVPIRFDRAWIAWPVLGAAAVAVGVWAPWVIWDRPEPSARRAVASRSQTAADVAQAAEAARAAVESSVGDIATPEQLRTLDALHEQLVSGDKDPEGARIEASRAIEQLAGGLTRSAEQERREQGWLREELAQLAESEGEEGPAAALSEALRQGDLEAGRQAVRELMDQVETWTPEQRERLAEDLERLSQPPELPQPSQEPAGGEGAQESQPSEPGAAAGEAGQPPASVGRRLSDEVRQDLEQQGIAPEQIEQVAQGTDPRQVEEQLREAGVEPTQAERLAERIAQENQQRNAEEEAQRQIEQMRESMREAAEDLRQPPEPGDGQQQPTGEPRDNQQQPALGERRPDGGERSPDQNGQDQGRDGENQQPGSTPDASGAEQQPGTQPESRPQQKPGSEPGSQPGAAPQPGQGNQSGDRPDQQPTQSPGGTPDAQQPGQQQPAPTNQPGAQPRPGAAPGDQQGQSPTDAEGGRSGERSGEGEQPGATPGERPGARPEGQPGREGEQRGAQQPGEQQGEPGAQQGEGQGQGEGEGRAPGQGQGRGLERLGKQFERLAREAQGAEQDAEKAQRLREAAQKLLEESTPEEREQLRRWAEKMREEQQRGGRPFPTSRPWSGTETVDARPQEESAARQDERVVAQWFSDEPAPRDGEVGRASAAERVRRAAQSAERSVEGQPISSRHRELVKRVFRRYAERAEDGELNPGPERR